MDSATSGASSEARSALDRRLPAPRLALGADLRTRLYPNTGPALRDRTRRACSSCCSRHSTRDGRRSRRSRSDAGRGWIDARPARRHRARLWPPRSSRSCGARAARPLVGGEGRRAAELGRLATPRRRARDEPLLVVRRTRATREIASALAHQLRVAYPAHPDDALAALTGLPPGLALLLWAVLDGQRSRCRDARPCEGERRRSGGRRGGRRSR